MGKKKITPLMQQFFEIKTSYPDTLLFFQVGDFYELFFDDAKTAASFLGITLTKRGKHNDEPVPLCGVPVHAKDHYVTKLVRGGFKVAICDQLEQAVAGKVVKRGVTRVLTPGMLTDDTLLDKKHASYLLSFFPSKNGIGFLFGEVMTAQLFATILPEPLLSSISTELSRFFPDEVIIPDIKEAKPFFADIKKMGYFTSQVAKLDAEQEDSAQQWRDKQFEQKTIDHFSQYFPLQMALSYFHAYVEKHNNDVLNQFTQCTFYEPEHFLHLDAVAKRNLELIKNMRDGTRKHTLLSVIDHAQTPMGSRTISKWLLRPLVDKKMITARHDTVALLMRDIMTYNKVERLLRSIGDLERIVGRIALLRAHQQDYVGLTNALLTIAALVQTLQQNTVLTSLLQFIMQYCSGFEELHQYLSRAINDDLSHNCIIKDGFDEKLDYLRSLVHSSSKRLLQLEQQEKQKTGIQSLKVRYNQVHGYYIEVTKTNLSLVPEHYVRMQTLVGKERFITNELQQIAQDIEQAKHKIDEVEQTIFTQVKQQIAQYVGPLRKAAHAVATLDALMSFADNARSSSLVRPTFNDKQNFVIVGGRHLVVEHALQNSFVPNDLHLDDQQSTLIITGPNMGGKSTYLRQNALISVLAQIGSFVPAKQADVPIVDAIFTRIGAGDHLAEGKSTFFVEMEETAIICKQATEKSLVILDEVGRGTSTFDGLALAQAVVEYLQQSIGARCLFATHYHELTDLYKQFPAVVNYYAASKKVKDNVIFLHQLIPGVADESFGIHVGKLADLPISIISRAKKIVHGLRQKQGVSSQQLSIYQTAQKVDEKPIREHGEIYAMLQSVNFDEMSPKNAFDLLWQMRQKIR